MIDFVLGDHDDSCKTSLFRFTVNDILCYVVYPSMSVTYACFINRTELTLVHRITIMTIHMCMTFLKKKETPKA